MRLALVLLLAAAPVLAQAPRAAGVTDIRSGSYHVDPGHTQVLFTVNHLGTSLYTGQFTQPTGSFTLDVSHPQNDRVDISFPIAKVSTTVAALDAHLQKPEFFDAARFPTGRFTSTRVTISGTSATIVGDLTLKGVTRPVTLQARFVGAGNNPMSHKANVGFHATTSIKRSDFGVSYGVPLVSDNVDLVINAAFEAD